MHVRRPGQVPRPARVAPPTGWLRSWNRSGDLLHRRRRTGSGRTGGHDRAGGGGDHLSQRPGHATMAQRERLGVADGRRDPGRTPGLIYRTRSGPRWCTSWLAEGGMPPGLGPASSLLDPLRDHALAGTCGDAQLGRGPRSRLIESPLAGSEQDARHLGQQIRPVTRCLAELGRRRGDFGLGWLTPAGMPPGYAVQAGNEQTVRGGSGAIAGHQATIEHEYDKGKLAKPVFRPRTSRKDRRRRLSRPRRRTVCPHWGI